MNNLDELIELTGKISSLMKEFNDLYNQQQILCRNLKQTNYNNPTLKSMRKEVVRANRDNQQRVSLDNVANSSQVCL